MVVVHNALAKVRIFPFLSLKSLDSECLKLTSHCLIRCPVNSSKNLVGRGTGGTRIKLRKLTVFVM